MRYTYIRPFVDAAQTILEQVLSARVVAGEPQLAANTVASRGVAAISGITGEAEGRLLLDMSSECALRIAEVMNAEELPELDELGKDTLAELTSMITGRAVSILNDAGHQLKVSPPTLLVGDNLTVSGPELETLVVPLETPFEVVMVNLAISTG